MLAYDDCQASAISALVEVLDIANLYAARGDPQAIPRFGWVIVSPDGRPPRAMGGVTLAVAGAPADVPAPDLIFVPGLHFTGDTAHFLAQIRALAARCGDWLAAQPRHGRMLALSCAGAFVAAEAGLLDGRQATTSWWLGKLFRATYPRVGFREGELVVADAGVLSSGAFTACLDLSLRVVEHFAGPALALACSKVLLIHAKRESQFPYMTLQARADHGDELVLRAQSHIRSHVRQDLSIEQLAQALNTTPRTLHRRFHAALGCSPKHYIQEVRVDGAKRLLESTDLSYEEIVRRVGQEDPRAFRRVFARLTQVSPREYRRMFAHRKAPAAAAAAGAGTPA